MKRNSILSNVSWNMLGMILYNIVLWILSFLTLRLLGAKSSGYYGIAMSVGATFYAVSLWGLRSFIISDDKFSIEDFIFTRFLSICFSFVCLIVYLQIVSFNFDEYIVVLLYCMFKFSESFIEVIDCICQKNLNMKINAISMILRSFLLATLFFVFSYFTKSLILGIISMFLTTLFVGYFYNYRLIKRDFKFNFLNVKKILFMTFPIMFFETLSSLTVLTARIQYKNIGSIEDFGIYVSIYSLIIFLQLVIQIFIVSISPYMANDYIEKNIKEFFKKLIFLILIALCLGIIAEICVYFLGEYVIGIIYGKEISKYYTYMYWGIVSGTTLGITWIFSQLFVILKKNYKQLISSFLSILSCFVFSSLFIVNNDVNNISKVLFLCNLVFIISSIFILIFDYKRGNYD